MAEGNGRTTGDSRGLTHVVAPALSADLWGRIAHGAPDPGTLRLLRTARATRDLLLLRALHHHARGTAIWDPAIAVLTAVRRRAPAVFDTLLSDPATGTVLASEARGLRSAPGTEPEGLRGAALARSVRRQEGVGPAERRGAAAGGASGAGLAPGRPDPGGPRDVGAVPWGPAGGVGVLAVVAAHRAGLPFRLRVPVHDGTLVLPGLGRAVLGPGADTAWVERGPSGTTVSALGGRVGVRVPERPEEAAPGWEPLSLLRLTAHGARLTLRLDSHGPLGSHVGPAEAARWRDRLGAAWERLVSRHPDRAGTVRGTVSAVVPLTPGAPVPGARAPWLSASFSDAFGLVALAPLDDPAELAAALVHETQHSLLYALQDLTRLLDAPPGRLATAPWNGRPRPPSALLQGAAAFLVTAGFWRTEAALGDPAARAPYERWRHTARRAGDELARHDWLTTSGRLLLDAMRQLLAEWEETPL